ncbi:MAG: polyphosphate polymerase domain-containing protein [Nannocystaceae bacterium]
MSAITTNTIERREYKYLIDRERASAVRAAIQPFCDLDPWAARDPRGRYTIESLYFDTRDLRLFWANDHEVADRVKVRVRGYAGAPASAPIFFEVKRRIGDVIRKTRGRVPRACWTQILADPAAPIPAEIGGRDRPAVERFLALCRTMHLRPHTLVRYEREPHFSRIDDYVRVTFDTRIRAQAMDRLSLVAPDRGWRSLDDAVTQRELESLLVLELKFTNVVPLWLSHVVERLDLTRRSFSKYGTSIRAFYQQLAHRRPAARWRGR